MRNIEIDLAQPFEEFLETVLSLPAGCSSAGAERLENEAELEQAFRGLHEAANGRRVETTIGCVQIAPPVAPFLKEKFFYVATQIDFLIEAATRIICGPAQFNCGPLILEVVGRNAFSANDRGEPALEAPRRRSRQPAFSRTSMITKRYD